MNVDFSFADVVHLFHMSNRYWLYTDTPSGFWSLRPEGFDSYDDALRAAEAIGAQIVLHSSAFAE